MPQPETIEQGKVRRFYTAVGCNVYVLSRKGRFGPRGSGITPGVPDLYVIHAQVGGFWHETKAGWKQTDKQQQFQLRCERAGVSYVLGGVEAARAFLRLRGVVDVVRAS